MSTFQQMTEHGHERVCFFHDAETGLRAIIAIHSTKLGNALGGTRRWHYASEAEALQDVLRLSEGMTYKAAAAGLPMGGAKSVILLPGRDTPATEAEGRAMGRFVDTLSGAYIAAEDVGVDPQFVDWMAMETGHVMGGITRSKGGDPSPFTAHGLVHGMRACLTHLGLASSFEGLTVAIQGVGHVGYNVARILHEAGAKLIVADINAESVQRAAREFGATIATIEEILTADCDVLAPCALGGVISGTDVRSLRCRIVCGAANNILDDPDEDAVALKNAGILYAPDFVVNAGGLIHLAGLYLKMTPEELDQKNADIETTTAQILRESGTMPSTHAAAVAYARRVARQSPRPAEQVHAG
ncbi:MAG: Glu/Leu/Phe/Val family dehydrogenase [Planctomycetota bacterium]|jgi:leucine dehydrogenase